jgi:hypothetical protein
MLRYLYGPAPTLSPCFRLAQAIFVPNLLPYKYQTFLKPSHSSYLPAYEDGTDRVFRNVGIQNSDAGELPRRKHTTFSITLLPQMYASPAQANARILTYPLPSKPSGT